MLAWTEAEPCGSQCSILSPNIDFGHDNTDQQPADMACGRFILEDFLKHNVWSNAPEWFSKPISFRSRGVCNDSTFDQLTELIVAYALVCEDPIVEFLDKIFLFEISESEPAC